MILATLVVVIFVLTALSFANVEDGAVSSAPNYDYGLYTYERSSLCRGEELRFYESGDESFRYYHDEEGYVLLRDFTDGSVNYARSDGGVPVDSGVSVGASPENVAAVPKMTAADFSPEYIEENSVWTYASAGKALSDENVVSNIIIFIEFKDESASYIDDRITFFDDEAENSLYDYFWKMSDGNIAIKSYYPETSSGVYVYEDSENRSYYNITDQNGSTRRTREAQLLTNAVAAAKENLTLPSDVELDVDGDGYIDSVTFLIAGSSSDDYGALLWPHSWNLDDIDGSRHSEIDGVKVGDYSFNFLDSMTLGLLAHETAHVFGAPDLYHSSYDYAPVGEWCLMQSQHDIPQYMLTYVREKYIGGLAEGRIGDITASGNYELSPVDSETGRIAYRIYTENPDEYFMVEYRRKTDSGFESGLPGSGLVVYRVREPDDFESSRGNIDAEYHGTGSKADEVFVFRPEISTGGTRYTRSVQDLKKAWLSPQNADFKSVGKSSSTGKYDSSALYYSDGENSGLVITATAISEDTISFTVDVPGGDLPDSYFLNKFSLISASFVNSTDYSGVTVMVECGDIEPEYVSGIAAELYSDGKKIEETAISHEEFSAAYSEGQRRFEAAFVVNDKGNSLDGLYRKELSTATEPDEARLVVNAGGRHIQIASASIDDVVSWATVVNTETQLKAGIFASGDMTLGMTVDGKIDVSGSQTSGKWGAEGFENAVTAAVGYSHVVVVDDRMKVHSFGTNYYNECEVSDWTDVVSVAAGYHVTYARHADGSVSATGLNARLVDGWTGVVQIAAGLRHVVAVTESGTLLYAGSNASGQLEGLGSVGDAVMAAAGDGFTAILKKDGSVVVTGNVTWGEETGDWTNVVKIAAGSRHLLALTDDGRVLAAGDNGYGQCGTARLGDIADIAAGDSHSAFLRVDGTVLYAGVGADAVNGIGNLIYSDYRVVTGIELVTDSVTLAAGDSVAIAFAVLPANATYKKLSITLSDDSVASFSEGDGAITVTAVEAGCAALTIRAEGGDVSVTVEIVVTPAVTGITFGTESIRLFPGDEYTPVVSFLPGGAWHEGEVALAITDENGVVTFENGVLRAKAAGEATLTATLGGFTCELRIEVADPETISSLTLEGKTGEADPFGYYYGEAFDPTRYNLKVTTEGGTTSSYPLETVNYILNGFNPFGTSETDVEAEITAELSYGGKTASVLFTVADYVVTAAPTEETERRVASYIQLLGDELPDDTKGTYSYSIGYASGKSEPRLFALVALQGYDKNVSGPQTLTYTHNEHTKGDEKPGFELVLNVYDYATGIEYSPSESDFTFGEKLPGTDFAEVTMKSGEVRNTELWRLEVEDEENGGIAEDSPYFRFNSLVAGEHRVKVSYIDPALAAKGMTAEISTVITLNVLVVPQHSIEGTYFTDGSTRRYVYPVGGSYDFEIVSVQDGKRFTAELAGDEKEILSSPGGLFYLIEFDPSESGNVDTYFRIAFISQDYDGNGKCQKTVTYLTNLTTTDVPVRLYGYSPDAGISLKPVRSEYDYDDTIQAYFSLVDGEKEILFDTFTPEYTPGVGNVSLTAEFMGKSYSAMVYVPDKFSLKEISDITAEYGDEIVFEVWAVSTITGEERLLSAEEYSVQGSLDSTETGRRTITISYNNAETDFELNVIDPIDSVEVLRPPKITYIAGDVFNPSSEYVFIRRSGAEVTVSYSAASAFTVSPEPAEYPFGDFADITFTISYEDAATGKEIVVWTGTARLINRPVAITAEPVGDYVFVGYEPELTVKAVFSDGTATALGEGDYEVEFDSSGPGQVAGTVKYTYDVDEKPITCVFTIRVIREPASISLTPPEKKYYGYGEAIDWTGAIAVVRYKDGTSETVPSSEFKTFFRISYNPLVEGTTTVKVTIGTVSAGFDVTFAAKALAINAENTDFASIDIAAERIVMYAPGKVDTARAVIHSANSYLTPQYVRQDGTIVRDYTLSAVTGDELRYLNADGMIVFNFKIFVRGDTDGDGSVTQNDIFGMADALVGKGEEGLDFDFDSDGVSSLKDLINYQRTTVPSPSPLQNAARAFIAPADGTFGRKRYV